MPQGPQVETLTDGGKKGPSFSSVSSYKHKCLPSIPNVYINSLKSGFLSCSKLLKKKKKPPKQPSCRKLQHLHPMQLIMPLKCLYKVHEVNTRLCLNPHMRHLVAGASNITPLIFIVSP